MIPPLFSLENATVAYRSKVLLKRVTCELNRGDFLGIIGPNGAGKSTLLMTLIGFRRLASGAGSVLETDIAALDQAGWTNIRKRVGYLPQTTFVDPFFPVTVYEVLLMGRISKRKLFRHYTEEDHRIVDEYLEEMALIDLRNRPIGQLSGGEQQKVHLARILVQEPDLILLDEPLSGLDLKWQQKISEMIDGIARRGDKGIVMVTHETQHLPPSCTHVALMHKGEMSRIAPVEDFFEDAVLSAVYGCTVKRFSHDARTYLSPWRTHD